MKELSRERLEYLLAIMKQNSIQYAIDNISYEMRLIPETQQACKQIKALIRETEKAKLIWDVTCPGINTNWLPTAGNINTLPKPVRNYIAGLETNADPPSMVADNIILRDTVKALEIKVEERLGVTEGWIGEKARGFMAHYPVGKHYVDMEKFVKDFIRSLFGEK